MRRLTGGINDAVRDLVLAESHGHGNKATVALGSCRIRSRRVEGFLGQCGDSGQPKRGN